MTGPDFRLYLTHGYLNIVHAGYQGKYVAINAAAQLSGTDADPAEIAALQEHLNAIIRWFQGLWQEVVMIDRAGREDPSPEAPALMALWDALRDEKRDLVADLSAVYADGNTPSREEIHLLATTMCRHAYAHEHYIKGLVGWGERFNDELVADRWRQHLLPCQNEIRVAHKVLAALQEGSNDELDRQLHDECMLLPAVLRSQLHDMATLEARRAGGLSFARLRIDETEARDWRTLNLGPEAAGYWRAYGFTPLTAQRWLAAGFTHFAEAGVWFARGFTAGEAIRWRDDGYEPLQAMQARVSQV